MSTFQAFAMSFMQSTDLGAAAGSPAILLAPVGGPASTFPALRRTATERSQRLSRHESYNHRRQRSGSGSGASMISLEEYETLPSSIQ